jgi:hypothetical protein
MAAVPKHVLLLLPHNTQPDHDVGETGGSKMVRQKNSLVRFCDYTGLETVCVRHTSEERFLESARITEALLRGRLPVLRSVMGEAAASATVLIRKRPSRVTS